MAEKNAGEQTTHPTVTAVILAGGAGVRAGRRDKGLVDWHGRPLVDHVYQHIAPQVGEVIISCNRNAELYSRFAEETFPDLRPDYQGPLAGLEAAVTHLNSEFVLVVPCDSPQLPGNLVARLLQPLVSSESLDGCYARSGDRNHYLCALLRRNCLDSLTNYLDKGGRAVRHWFSEYRISPVEFGDDTGTFLNINQPD